MANNKVKIVVGFPANGGGNEVDGGFANSVYLSSQQIDGGNA
jgi:hypothetical protein